MTADDAVTSALDALAVALDVLGAPAMIIGGLAAIARGVPRTTLDIDATVWAEGLDVGLAQPASTSAAQGSRSLPPRT